VHPVAGNWHNINFFYIAVRDWHGICFPLIFSWHKTVHQIARKYNSSSESAHTYLLITPELVGCDKDSQFHTFYFTARSHRMFPNPEQHNRDASGYFFSCRTKFVKQTEMWWLWFWPLDIPYTFSDGYEAELVSGLVAGYDILLKPVQKRRSPVGLFQLHGTFRLL
jgi:hypothetical protein